MDNASAAHFEPLGKNCCVLVSTRHRFNTDTLLLADFSMPKRGEICADIGTGCGAIPLLWCARGKPKSVVAVEIQRDAAELAEKSVNANGFSSEIKVLCADVRGYKEIFGHQSLDLIACNPPYFVRGSGFASISAAEKTARHDENLTLRDLAGVAKFSLKFGGRLCVCMPTDRMAEVIGIFRASGLEPKRLTLVQSTPVKPPYLFLLECKRGGKTGLEVKPNLVLNDAFGRATPQLNKIYGDYLETAGRENQHEQ